MRAAHAVALVALAVGCSRAHYRRQADFESYDAIAERNQCPAWALPRTNITPAPDSRIADPYNPDFPPMPPDDPFAHRYMHCVDGMHGWRHWHIDGDAPSVEPPGWRDSLPLDAENALPLTPDTAVEIALANSREYQRALEDVYLLALGLTLNRFEFDCHWFGRNDSTLRQFGSSATELNTFSTFSDVGFTRNFAAGGQLLVDFANSVVVTFRGGQTAVSSNVLVQLIQPLLRNAGRQVRLEDLTQAERTLLYAVRDFARFRKDFYADLTTRGNGYLGLLLQLQNIRNFEANIASQEQNLRLHEALFAGGIVSTVQVDQVFQSYQQARFTLLLAQVGYNNDLDSYKLRLGLPPDLAVKLDDSQLNPFQLSSPELMRDQTDLDKLLAGLRQRDQPPTVDELHEGLDRLSGFVERARGYTTQIDEELGKWRGRLDDPNTMIDTASREREQTLYRTLLKQSGVAKDGLNDLAAQLARAAAGLREANRPADWRLVLRLARTLIAKLGELFVVQTQIRVFLIDLPSVHYEEGPAIQTALECRLDLMNQRGRVVDSWRKITVTANGLDAGLNLILTAQPTTAPGSHNPFDFSSKASQYSAELQFDAPLNRVAARNIYRQSLVDYQRSRREFMAAEDQIRLSIRRDLRQLAADRQGFGIARLTLLAAARQLEGARESLLLAEKGSDSTTSTLNILNALDGLLQARNALIGRYVSYETNRLQLLLDLEALQLDERGLPINVSPFVADQPQRPATGAQPPNIADLVPAVRRAEFEP
jgi:outer membrane protein TolC